MLTDWNQKKLQYNDQALSWDERDDVQRLLVMLQNDTVDVLNTYLEYGFVLDFTSEHQSYINKAPQFWKEVIKSLCFTLIMKSARLFDESSDSIGLNKVFNILEQSSYRNDVAKILVIARKQYDKYGLYINEIKTIRDKIYAHNDKKEYQFWKYPSENDYEFNGEFWDVLDEILIWARDTILSLRTLIGDSFPVNMEITNDLCNLLVKTDDL